MMRLSLLKVTAVLMSLLLWSTSAWAAIAFVSNTEAANTLSVSSITTSVTVSAGSDRVLWIAAQAVRSGGVLPGVITGITFNGSEAFSFVTTGYHNGTYASRVELWCLVAPTVTTANVVVTYTDASNDRVQTYNAISFTGAQQTCTADASNATGGSGGTASTVVTTVAADAWIVDSVIGGDTLGFTVGSGQTARSDRILGANSHGVASSTVDGKASPGTETMDWTQGSASDWAISAASFAPAAAGGGPTCRGALQLLGVGGC